jgi:hypothetical protein
MIMRQIKTVFLLTCFLMTGFAYAGPYTEEGVYGYIDPNNHCRPANPTDHNAILNPIFRGWATTVASYKPAPGVYPMWAIPQNALGPVTGNETDIVSLGDLSQSQINQGILPGQITLLFGDPCNPADPNHIRNVNGHDFVVFENGFISDINSGGGSIGGQMFAELGYVEVSSDGNHFARFSSVSLTGSAVGAYGTIEISNIFNLAGKHPNKGDICSGTPFDLSELTEHPLVVSGVVDINNISYVRIVDIPGSGDFNDNATQWIDANSWPNWDYYSNNHPIYDAWVTRESGGLDLEAIGVLNQQEYPGDINLDGVVDIFDLKLFCSAWLSHFGQNDWIARCDMAEPKDLTVNFLDYAVFANKWRQKEKWSRQ